MTSPQSEERRGENAAEIAAALYASFLRVRVPSSRAKYEFTPEQAFELTRMLFHESLRDEET
jgi:hypothetical protein